MKTIRVEKAKYIDGYKIEIFFSDETVKSSILELLF